MGFARVSRQLAGSDVLKWRALLHDGDGRADWIVFFLNARRQVEEHELEGLLLGSQLAVLIAAAFWKGLRAERSAAESDVHVAEHHATAFGEADGRGER